MEMWSPGSGDHATMYAVITWRGRHTNKQLSTRSGRRSMLPFVVSVRGLPKASTKESVVNTTRLADCSLPLYNKMLFANPSANRAKAEVIARQNQFRKLPSGAACRKTNEVPCARTRQQQSRVSTLACVVAFRRATVKGECSSEPVIASNCSDDSRHEAKRSLIREWNVPSNGSRVPDVS